MWYFSFRESRMYMFEKILFSFVFVGSLLFSLNTYASVSEKSLDTPSDKSSTRDSGRNYLYQRPQPPTPPQPLPPPRPPRPLSAPKESSPQNQNSFEPDRPVFRPFPGSRKPMASSNPPIANEFIGVYTLFSAQNGNCFKHLEIASARFPYSSSAENIEITGLPRSMGHSYAQIMDINQGLQADTEIMAYPMYTSLGAVQYRMAILDNRVLTYRVGERSENPDQNLPRGQIFVLELLNEEAIQKRSLGPSSRGMGSVRSESIFSGSGYNYLMIHEGFFTEPDGGISDLSRSCVYTRISFAQRH